jgi:phosphoserine phosphatase
MTKIILTRHGHVDGISPLRFRGQTELSLTPRGRAQVMATAARIAARWQPHSVYTSPIGRCVATGEAIAEACGASRQIIKDLIDFNYGAWQWLTVDEVRAAWPDLLAGWYATPHLVRFPGGDALQDLVARTANALRFILERHPDDVVVMVGHETANRAILLQLLDQPLSAYWRLAQAPCAINVIEISDGRVRVDCINDVSHLSRIA